MNNENTKSNKKKVILAALLLLLIAGIAVLLLMSGNDNADEGDAQSAIIADAQTPLADAGDVVLNSNTTPSEPTAGEASAAKTPSQPTAFIYDEPVPAGDADDEEITLIDGNTNEDNTTHQEDVNIPDEPAATTEPVTTPTGGGGNRGGGSSTPVVDPAPVDPEEPEAISMYDLAQEIMNVARQADPDRARSSMSVDSGAYGAEGTWADAIGNMLISNGAISAGDFENYNWVLKWEKKALFILITENSIDNVPGSVEVTKIYPNNTETETGTAVTFLKTNPDNKTVTYNAIDPDSFIKAIDLPDAEDADLDFNENGISHLFDTLDTLWKYVVTAKDSTYPSTGVDSAAYNNPTSWASTIKSVAETYGYSLNDNDVIWKFFGTNKGLTKIYFTNETEAGTVEAFMYDGADFTTGTCTLGSDGKLKDDFSAAAPEPVMMLMSFVQAVQETVEEVIEDVVDVFTPDETPEVEETLEETSDETPVTDTPVVEQTPAIVPEAAVEPEAPAAPETPAEPEATETPEAPAEPEAPATPDAPAEAE